MYAWEYSSGAIPWETDEPIEVSLYPLGGVLVSVTFGKRVAALSIRIESELGLRVFGREAARDLADKVTDRLALEFDLALDPLVPVLEQLDEERAVQSFPIRSYVGQAPPSTAALLALVGRGWGQESGPLAAACHIYREAKATHDLIARFILQWSLLVMLNAGSEHQADESVSRAFPEIPQVVSRARNGRTITQVLDVRDSIAHMVRHSSEGGLSVPALRERVRSALPFLESTLSDAVRPLLGEDSGSVEQAHQADAHEVEST